MVRPTPQFRTRNVPEPFDNLSRPEQFERLRRRTYSRRAYHRSDESKIRMQRQRILNRIDDGGCVTEHTINNPIYNWQPDELLMFEKCMKLRRDRYIINPNDINDIFDNRYRKPYPISPHDRIGSPKFPKDKQRFRQWKNRPDDDDDDDSPPNSDKGSPNSKNKIPSSNKSSPKTPNDSPKTPNDSNKGSPPNDSNKGSPTTNQPPLNTNIDVPSSSRNTNNKRKANTISPTLSSPQSNNSSPSTRSVSTMSENPSSYANTISSPNSSLNSIDSGIDSIASDTDTNGNSKYSEDEIKSIIQKHTPFSPDMFIESFKYIINKEGTQFLDATSPTKQKQYATKVHNHITRFVEAVEENDFLKIYANPSEYLQMFICNSKYRNDFKITEILEKFYLIAKHYFTEQNGFSNEQDLKNINLPPILFYLGHLGFEESIKVIRMHNMNRKELCEKTIPLERKAKKPYFTWSELTTKLSQLIRTQYKSKSKRPLKIHRLIAILSLLSLRPLYTTDKNERSVQTYREEIQSYRNDFKCIYMIDNLNEELRNKIISEKKTFITFNHENKTGELHVYRFKNNSDGKTSATTSASSREPIVARLNHQQYKDVMIYVNAQKEENETYDRTSPTYSKFLFQTNNGKPMDGSDISQFFTKEMKKLTNCELLPITFMEIRHSYAHLMRDKVDFAAHNMRHSKEVHELNYLRESEREISLPCGQINEFDYNAFKDAKQQKIGNETYLYLHSPLSDIDLNTNATPNLTEKRFAIVSHNSQSSLVQIVYENNKYKITNAKNKKLPKRLKNEETILNATEYFILPKNYKPFSGSNIGKTIKIKYNNDIYYSKLEKNLNDNTAFRILYPYIALFFPKEDRHLKKRVFYFVNDIVQDTPIIKDIPADRVLGY